jgi:CheY-like chemotaxis protein
MGLEHKTIFVIEDDPTNLAVIRIALMRYGASVPFDHWGDTTLKTILQLAQVDLILLDLKLPGKANGYDILAAIKEQPSLAKVPVVIVSASDADVEVPKAREKGASGFISKPINRTQLVSSIEIVLNGGQIWPM